MYDYILAHTNYTICVNIHTETISTHSRLLQTPRYNLCIHTMDGLRWGKWKHKFASCISKQSRQFVSIVLENIRVPSGKLT